MSDTTRCGIARREGGCKEAVKYSVAESVAEDDSQSRFPL